MDITKDLTMKQMTELPEFAPMRYAFIGAAGDWLSQIEENCTLEGMTRKHPTWYYGDIMYGLKKLSDVAKKEKQYVFPIYIHILSCTSKVVDRRSPLLDKVQQHCLNSIPR